MAKFDLRIPCGMGMARAPDARGSGRPKLGMASGAIAPARRRLQSFAAAASVLSLTTTVEHRTREIAAAAVAVVVVAGVVMLILRRRRRKRAAYARGGKGWTLAGRPAGARRPRGAGTAGRPAGTAGRPAGTAGRPAGAALLTGPPAGTQLGPTGRAAATSAPTGRLGRSPAEQPGRSRRPAGRPGPSQAGTTGWAGAIPAGAIQPAVNGWPPAGWYTDPTGRYPWRWWDGRRWTTTARNQGREIDDRTG